MFCVCMCVRVCVCVCADGALGAQDQGSDQVAWRSLPGLLLLRLPHHTAKCLPQPQVSMDTHSPSLPATLLSICLSHLTLTGPLKRHLHLPHVHLSPSLMTSILSSVANRLFLSVPLTCTQTDQIQHVSPN